MTVCSKCKGPNVQIKVWVDPNTLKVYGVPEDANGDDTWCDDCNDHTGVEDDESHHKDCPAIDGFGCRCDELKEEGKENE